MEQTPVLPENREPKASKDDEQNEDEVLVDWGIFLPEDEDSLADGTMHRLQALTAVHEPLCKIFESCLDETGKKLYSSDTAAAQNKRCELHSENCLWKHTLSKN